MHQRYVHTIDAGGNHAVLSKANLKALALRFPIKLGNDEPRKSVIQLLCLWLKTDLTKYMKQAAAQVLRGKPDAIISKKPNQLKSDVVIYEAIKNFIMDKKNIITRREAIGSLGIGLAGVAMSPNLNAATLIPHNDSPNNALEDPTTKYPRPPFNHQNQPWPALASKMVPRPDHGESSYKGSGRLTGRKALITGGDSGMGRAAAIAYAREGADVAINYLPQEEPDAKEVIELIKKAGRKAVAIPGDIRDEAFCKKLVDTAVSQLGGLDILISNAARQQSTPSLAELTSEQFDWTIKTNIYAPFWIIKAALPHLKPGSSIIGTTSVQATDPSPDLFDYAQTKAATTNFVKSLAKQLGPKGIRVNGVAPGPIWTPLQMGGGSTPEKLKEFGKDTPMGRPGQPAELASIYVQLAANDASFSTGQIYGAAGGNGQP